ncbi:MAG: hypothetical protein ABI591_13700 [Kofleriaceae bacterium]
MGTDSDRIPRETPVAGTNKIAMSRIEVPDLIGPTTQMPPLFPDGTTAASLVIEEHVPTYSGEHPTLVGRDSLQVPVIDLRASGLVPIDDDEDAMINAIAAVDEAQLSSEGLMPAAPVLPIDDASTDTTMKHQRSAGTSLGVAPLEPATTVRAPFVVDTPVPRRSPLGRMTPSSTPPLESALVAKPESSANLPRASSDENSRERTAMLALDPSSGMPRSGPWQAIVAVAKSLRSIRWWLRRRTSRVRPVRR